MDIFFSIIIPAHNEETGIAETCIKIIREFSKRAITDYEVLVVNDNSSDATEQILQELSFKYPTIRYVNNPPPNGYGLAVRCGLEHYRGKCVCVVMADSSESPSDIVAYYRVMREGYDCVFGSRFIEGGQVFDYPKFKLFLNRLVNWVIMALFLINHNDMTNGFKGYTREVIAGVQPLVSPHFSLAVEIPLKAIVRGYNFATIPISWYNRKAGESKLHLGTMSRRYLFIILSVLLEKLLVKEDYYRKK